MITIDLHGDSTQKGGGSVQSLNPPSQVLSDYLNGLYPGMVTVNNLGVGGSKISDCWNGTGGYTKTFEAAMTTSIADIVVVNHAINDANAGVTATSYLNYVNLMSTSAQAHGKRFHIETPNLVNQTFNTTLLAYVLKLYTGTLTPLTKIIDVNRLLNNYSQYWVTQLQSDGVHPNDNMYKYNGTILCTALEPKVRQMLGFG